MDNVRVIYEASSCLDKKKYTKSFNLTLEKTHKPNTISLSHKKLLLKF